MKFGEQPAYSKEAYEDTEQGIKDIKSAARGEVSTEALRSLAAEKQALESQKAELHGQAFDEATLMDQEHNVLAADRTAQAEADAAEAAQLRAEILGEDATLETTSSELSPVQADQELTIPPAGPNEKDVEDASLINGALDIATEDAGKGLGKMPNIAKLEAKSADEMDVLVEKLRDLDDPEARVVQESASQEKVEGVPRLAENVSKSESATGFLDKVKSFFSGERKEESKESLLEKLNGCLGKERKKDFRRENMIDENGNFIVDNAYHNIWLKKFNQDKVEENIALTGGIATVLSGSGLMIAMRASVGIEGGMAAVVASNPWLGPAIEASIYATPAIAAVAAGAWAGVKLYNMYKRRKAARYADELFARKQGVDIETARNGGTLTRLKQNFGL